MKKIIFILLIINYFSLITSEAQNLALNPSFELSKNLSNVDTIYWGGRLDSSLLNWQTPKQCWCAAQHLDNIFPSPYFNSFGNSVPQNYYGYEFAATGKSYVGFFNYILGGLTAGYPSRASYPTGQLSAPLQSGQCYKVTFKHSLAEISDLAISNFGILFTDTIPSSNQTPWLQGVLDNYTPQIIVNQYLYQTDGWQTIERYFVAQGGEQYITLGRFQKYVDTIRVGVIDSIYFYVPGMPDSVNCNCSYSYIDDVSVEAVPLASLPQINLGNDTILCVGEQITFDSLLPNNPVYVWNNLSNDSVFTIDSTGLYWVEAYNGCAYTSDTINVEFVEPIENLGDDTILCKRQELLLQTNYTHPKVEYLWNTGDTLSQISPQDSGKYWLQTKVGHCQDEDTILISYHIPENVTLTSQNIDTTFCVEGILVADSSEWNDKYLWNTDEESQTIEITETGTYEVYAENECTEATSTFNVKIESLEEGLNNYNIFSPNGDFVNDVFSIYEGNSEEYQIQIYNRWGKLVWQTDDPTNHWSADGFNDGSYFYHLSFRNCVGEIVEQKGTVDVKR